VRWHRFTSLIEQAEPDSRLDRLGDALVEVKKDGYELGGAGSVAIGKVIDVPGETPCAERARFDAPAGGELLLGLRVAIYVEQVVPCRGATDDSRRREGIAEVGGGAFRRRHVRREW
jgi:hypothetical protein